MEGTILASVVCEDRSAAVPKFFGDVTEVRVNLNLGTATFKVGIAFLRHPIGCIYVPFCIHAHYFLAPEAGTRIPGRHEKSRIQSGVQDRFSCPDFTTGFFTAFYCKER